MTAILDFFNNLTWQRFFIDLLGYIAILFSIVSFQQKTQRKIAILQGTSNLFWMTHMFLLSAVAGGLLNLVGLLRGILFSLRETHEWARRKWVHVLLLTLIAGVTVFSWISGDGPKALLPALAMAITTFSLSLENPARVRLLSIFSSPCWIVYSVLAGSIPSVVAEILNLTSIAVGMLRLDRKKKE